MNRITADNGCHADSDSRCGAAQDKPIPSTNYPGFGRSQLRELFRGEHRRKFVLNAWLLRVLHQRELISPSSPHSKQFHVAL